MLGVKIVDFPSQDLAEACSDEYEIGDKDVFQGRRESVNQINQKNNSQHGVEVIVVPGQGGKKRNQDKQVGTFQDLGFQEANLLSFEHHPQQKQAGHANNAETQHPG